MLKKIKFMLSGHILLADTEHNYLCYITRPWEKQPQEWIYPSPLAYGCNSCDCQFCRNGCDKVYSPCKKTLRKLLPNLEKDINSWHYIKDAETLVKLSKEVAKADLNVIDEYIDDSPNPRKFKPIDLLLQELCEKEGYRAYIHKIDGATYQIYAGGISVNGYLNRVDEFCLDNDGEKRRYLISQMRTYLYYALLNDPDNSHLMDSFYRRDCMELKIEKPRAR